MLASGTSRLSGEPARDRVEAGLRRELRVALAALVEQKGLDVLSMALQLGRRKASRADKLTAAERMPKIRPMTWEQRDAFLEAAAGERRYIALFTVLAKAGLRPGEAFALKPGDLDLRGRTMRVERSWSLGRVKPTKTYEERVERAVRQTELLRRVITDNAPTAVGPGGDRNMGA